MEALKRKQEEWLEATAVLLAKDGSGMNKSSSSRTEEKWTDKRDICEI